MVEVIDVDLLQELCRKHGVPSRLVKRIISEFPTVDGPKKSYIRQIIEEWV